jgi:hypothetical protein
MGLIYIKLNDVKNQVNVFMTIQHEILLAFTRIGNSISVCKIITLMLWKIALNFLNRN